uniref:Uncharacterized protein n=1 Tax=viral metagenome TaxID=1070528 RepID=A0A6M3IFP3_9ZZZZ
MEVEQVQCITCGNLAEDKSRCLETGLTYSSAGEREMLRPCEGWIPIPEPPAEDVVIETPVEETGSENDTVEVTPDTPEVTPAAYDSPAKVELILPDGNWNEILLYLKRPGS